MARMPFSYPIWICRHGLTAWNAARRKQGHLDSALTPEGVAHAARLQAFFRDYAGRLYSSPLGRALTTSRTVAAHNHALPLIVDVRLREMGFGVLEGLLPHDIRAQCATDMHYVRENPMTHSPHGGESYGDVHGRIKPFVDSLPTKDVLSVIIVAHENVNRVLIAMVAGLDLGPSLLSIAHPHDVLYRVHGRTVDNINLRTGRLAHGVVKCNTGSSLI